MNSQGSARANSSLGLPKQTNIKVRRQSYWSQAGETDWNTTCPLAVCIFKTTF